MSPWKLPPRVEPDDELRAADEVLDKADALLRRHKANELPEPEEFVALDDDLEDDGLPVLTDVVDPAEVAALGAAAPAVAPPAPREAPPAADDSSAIAEHLIGLDTAVARAVESWFATELPQLLSRELDKLSDRLQQEALAHLRATLLPTLSEHISRSIESLPPRRS